MKKILFLLLISNVAAMTATAQAPWDKPPRFFLEVDGRSGEFTNSVSSSSLSAGYVNPLNAYGSKLTMSENNSYAFSTQVGYYFNEEQKFGIGLGLLYSIHSANLTADSFHVEYEAKDYNGNVFRQVVSSNGPISEQVRMTNMSIPVYLRYKKKLDEDFSVTVDGGFIMNLSQENKYTTNSSFDYEAIYDFLGTGTNLTFLYDNSSKPGPTDWLITRAQFLKDNPDGNANQYFSFLRTLGYNVGLGDSVQKTGKIKYSNVSIGFYLQGAINYKIRRNIYGKAGLYAYSENFSNNASVTTPLTTVPGTYNSLTEYVKSITVINYGVLFGIDYYF